MADVPLVFTTTVPALLAGTKTQTRRIIKDDPGEGWHCDPARGGGFRWVAEGGAPSMPVQMPYAVGDRIWVREACFNYSAGQTWRRRWLRESDQSECMTFSQREKPGKRAAFHMPRIDSRLTLIVTDVRVQRLQDISEDDAIAEGIFLTKTGAWSAVDGYPPLASKSARGGYYCLWNSLHDPGAWDKNPWVAAATFRVILANIDSQEAKTA